MYYIAQSMNSVLDDQLKTVLHHLKAALNINSRLAS